MAEFDHANHHLPQPQRLLIESLKGEKILLTDLLSLYLEYGLVVKKIYQTVEYAADTYPKKLERRFRWPHEWETLTLKKLSSPTR